MPSSRPSTTPASKSPCPSWASASCPTIFTSSSSLKRTVDLSVWMHWLQNTHVRRYNGDEDWRKTAAKRLGLESTLRPRGRPRQDEGATLS